MQVFTIYTLSNIIIFLVGKSLTHFVQKNISKQNSDNNSKVFGFNISTFYPIIALFFIGNISVLINFISPLKNYLILIPLFICLFDGFKKFKIKELGCEKIIIPLITFVTFFGINISEDLGLYHLNVISILQNEKLIIGSALFHKRFGYSSIYEYISNYFFIKNNLIFLHIIFLLFVNFFFIFLFNSIKNDNVKVKVAGISICLIGFLDNFGYSGGKNSFIDIENIGKFDTVLSILFISSFVILISFDIKSSSDFEVFILLLLITFSIQIKHTGILLVLVLAFTSTKIFKVIFRNKFSLLTFSIIFFFWFLKNIMISSCLFFPVEITCTNTFIWSLENYAGVEQEVVRSSLNSFTFDNNFNQNIMNWKNGNLRNFDTFKNIFVTFLILIFFQIIIFKAKIINFIKLIKGFIIFSLILTYVFFNVPESRFALGVLTSASILQIYYFELRNVNLNKYFFYILFFFCLLFYPRLDSYKNIQNGFEDTISVPQIEYRLRENSFGYEPFSGGESCWLNIKCTSSESINVNLIKKYGYKIFIPIK